MKILDDEQIQYILNRGIVKHSGLDIPYRRQAIDRDIAQAQLDQDREEMKALIDEIDEKVCYACSDFVRCTSPTSETTMFSNECVWWQELKKRVL